VIEGARAATNRADPKGDLAMHVIRMQFPAMNAISSALLEWLERELDRAKDEPILLTGTGPAFSAGLNLREVVNHDGAAMERLLDRLDRICARLFHHPAPTLAYVNGHAIAGGAVLMSCCDWRMIADDPQIKVGVNEVALGAYYPPRIFKILAQRLPAHHREEILLGAALYPPARALALGLADDLTTEGELAAERRLRGLAAHPRGTYAYTKAALRDGVTALTPAEEERFRKTAIAGWTSDDMKKRMLAALDRT